MSNPLPIAKSFFQCSVNRSYLPKTYFEAASFQLTDFLHRKIRHGENESRKKFRLKHERRILKKTKHIDTCLQLFVMGDSL